jgi:anti-anti-sigma regulatory factor
VLRINEDNGAKQFQLEGRLVDGSVDEVARIIGASDLRGITLEMSGLTFVDNRGVALLRSLAARGAELRGGTTFVKTVLSGDELNVTDGPCARD